VIVGVDRDRVSVRIREQQQHKRPHRRRVTVAAAVPKANRLRWMVEKLTELGVDRFVPLATQRGVVPPGPARLRKVEQTMIAAARQSRRNFLMTIEPVRSWADFIHEDDDAEVLVAHPSGEPMTIGDTPIDQPLHLAVGPEGGFSEAEVELADNSGARLIRLTETILRVETAAIAFASTALMDRRFRQAVC